MGCEKYNCDCSDIESAVNAYNSELENLASKDILGQLNGKLKQALDDYAEKLKKIEYQPGSKTPGNKEDCDQCGDCDTLKGYIKDALGSKRANAMMSCCSPSDQVDSDGDPVGNLCGKTKQAFSGMSNDLTPCEKDADDQKSAVLFPCNPFDGFELKSKEESKPKLKCKKEDGAKCPDAVKLSLTEDGQVTINIPDAEDMNVLQEKLSEIDTYLQNVNSALSNAKGDFGGQTGALKREACLNTLFDMICDGKITGNNRPRINDPGKKKDNACKNAMKSLGCKGDKWPQDLCEQLSTEIAWGSTLTYGHMGDAPKGCPGNNEWKKGEDKQNKDNDIPPCGEERIRTTLEVFVPAGGDPKAAQQQAINETLNDMREAFPNGCGTPSEWDSSNGPNLRKEQGDPKVIRECDGTGPCQGVPSGPKSVEAMKQTAPLKKQLADLKRTVDNLAFDRNKILDELSTIRKPAKGEDIEKEQKLRDALKKNQEDTQPLLEQMRNLQEQIAEIETSSQNHPIGTVIEIQVSYCPANSTPKSSGGGAGDAGGGGPNDGGNSNTENQENSNRNFYDMLRNLVEKTSQGNPCGASPLSQQLNDCFSGQTGKNPIGGTGNDSGPTLKPGGRGGDGPGDPCSENDGVDSLGASGPCTPQNDPNRSHNTQRRRCIDRLNNIAQGLKSKLDSSGLLQSKPGTELQKLTSAINELSSAISKIKQPKGDPSCSGFSTEEAVNSIKDVDKAFDSVLNLAGNLKL